MVEKHRLGWFNVSRRDCVIIFLLFDALAWYYMLISIANQLLSTLTLGYYESIVVVTVFCFAIVGFSLVGAVLADIFQRRYILYFWIVFGIVTSLLPAFFENPSLGHLVIFSLLWGASFGLGMPSCLALFADVFSVENRGFMSGIIFILTNLSALLIAVLTGSFSSSTNALVYAAWRALSLVAIFVPKLGEMKTVRRPQKQVSFYFILRDKCFVLYFVPWTLFCLINRLADPIIRPIYESSLGSFPDMVGPLVGSIFSLVGGLLADRIGRKKVVIYGFASLGVAYAIVGFVPNMVLPWYFFVLINAVSTGILWVVFILTLWGDLSPKSSSEKYYVIGNSPFFLTWGILQLFSANYLASIPTYAIFSFVSFFLFLAVLPLMYAPETLPEKKIKERELKEYIEKAKKAKERHT